MRFLCHNCGNSYFIVSNDKTVATCSKCGTATPFEEQQMANSPLKADQLGSGLQQTTGRGRQASG